MEDQVLLLPKERKKITLTTTLQTACKKIAPVWPLENFVAVNPYLGLTDKNFETVAQQLATVGGIQTTLPVSFYRNKIREGIISRKDLGEALTKKAGNVRDVDAFIQSLETKEDAGVGTATIATYSDVATQVTKQDWNRFVTGRISTWAASYFDKGQALWKASNPQIGLFKAWREEATVDLTTEITGLKGFRKAVEALSADPLQAAQKALEVLDVPESALPLYLHRLLLRVGGWSAYAARLDWDKELYGKKGAVSLEFLSVLLCWEACLLECLDGPQLRFSWLTAKKRLVEANQDTELSEELSDLLVLQEAFDLAAQRALIEKFQRAPANEMAKPTRPKAQAIFCIDVRSEVYRRNLEQADSEVETIGFAGFFAFPIQFVPLAHSTGEAQCPVLIPTGPTILEEIPDAATNKRAHSNRVLRHQLKQVWKSFKSGAITCFSFVSPMGLSYLPKLFTDSFGITRPVPHPDGAGLDRKEAKQKSISLEVGNHADLSVGIPLEQRTQLAKNALNAMSLTENFAPFVLIVGHGSTSVNNPHATGLDCGACGGHSGEANAKVAAAVLNDKEVRKQLVEAKLSIPEDTVFLACLHDTTTDEVSIFNEQEVPLSHIGEFGELKRSLAKAARGARAERALRMAITENQDQALISRSKDWSQVRPEWGLAGCSAFVVAPRERTKKLNFGGQSFLHSYDWKKDADFSILELIMTAPMVVTSWINLQYYGSTVDNLNFGSGNKTLHNVTAGLGVLEGYSGDLRVGLPMQSVHDGTRYQHEPLRLNVVIEAPIEAMNAILEKHRAVRDLCDNTWIFLLALDAGGKVTHRYRGNLQWEAL
ncbi:hypothetical protein SAMN05192553_102607 [Cyclobacterium xiamenense]|uniref:Probable inorganic carbon transporter subunit DabA n=1 Tax=Cyclobacterium xiamenense TaxID=1297121 RepID=A0A1H6WGR4_9BACT|nr:DUF2309 domain-containing protein [Cyclobacterium xiamenense]SEJ14394.1 hypothetical protein SAMN05192553_102607 [Cyclobacterium xiamenense]